MGKITVPRWKWDEVGDILLDEIEDVEKWLGERFEIDVLSARYPNIPTAYIFFGPKRKAIEWSRTNSELMGEGDVLTLAEDWHKMVGLRARPTPVYDPEWYKINRRHEIVQNARPHLYWSENVYGSGEPLPAPVRTYEEVLKERDEIERIFSVDRNRLRIELDAMYNQKYPPTMAGKH